MVEHCKHRNMIQGEEADDKAIVVCSLVQGRLGYQHGSTIGICKQCIQACPVQSERTESPVVSALVSVAAIGYVIGGPSWRAQKVSDPGKTIEQFFDLAIANRFEATVLRILEQAVINGESPEKAAELMARYESQKDIGNVLDELPGTVPTDSPSS